MPQFWSGETPAMWKDESSISMDHSVLGISAVCPLHSSYFTSQQPNIMSPAFVFSPVQCYGLKGQRKMRLRSIKRQSKVKPETDRQAASGAWGSAVCEWEQQSHCNVSVRESSSIAQADAAKVLKTTVPPMCQKSFICTRDSIILAKFGAAQAFPQ